MLGVVPMVMYNVDKNDTISPASLSGLMGIYTTNKTWFTAFFKTIFKRRSMAHSFWSRFWQYEFTVSGWCGSHHFTDIQTGADFLKLEVKRKIFSEVYLGGSYIYTKFDNEYKFDTPVEEEVTLNGLGLALLWDKRNDVYYANNKGIKSNLNYLNYPTFLGNESQSNEINFELNKFLAMRSDKDVLALRMYTVFGLGDVPFNNLAVMGGRGSDLRGYTQGEYRGKQMLAVQGEYRYNFPNNMGLVGFAGLGSIFQLIFLRMMGFYYQVLVWDIGTWLFRK